MKKFIPLLPVFLLSSAGAFAQIGAVNSGFSDTTQYRPPLASDTTHFTPLSKRQDAIFVFFNRYGRLTATQPQGRPARFTWQKLDTASLTFKTIWVDTVEVEKTVSDFFTETERDSSKCDSFPQQATYRSKRIISELPDSVGFGCYRVTTDTLRTLYDTVHCDSFYMVYKAADGTDSAAAYIKANILIAKDSLIVAADTFNAWVFIDAFRIDSIAREGPDCNELKLQAIFYPASEGYFQYTYLNLWRTPRKGEELKYPDCNDCYIKKATWTTTPDDIHKGADINADDAWKQSYIAFIPTPFYDAKYKIVVENYFGAKDTLETDVIEAKSTYAQMKLYAEKTAGDNAKGWEEKTNMGEPEMSPVSVYLANTSINAKDNATFTWQFFTNVYEQVDTTVMPPPIWQITTADSAETASPPEPYKPGRYPMTLLVANRHGCTDSDTITLEVEEFLIEPDAIPLLFTPNGDGKNDAYQLKDPDNNVHSVEAIEINIFNRYGQLVFRSRDVRFVWDGKLRNTNSLAPGGVYFYVIKAQGYNKQRKKVKQTFKGNIHLFN
ncbi:MAG: gliding motility-associated C-terminal domain-containing protein [Prevotellaceae bacterium]|nr:gliding motility-associated C-terminal domain-containing protein [Prevotellaceae bacterium]